MWLSKQAYQNLYQESVTARAEAAAFKETNRALQTSADWMRMRITQLEKERAAFLNHYLDVKIPVPEVVQKAPDPFESHPFNDMAALFNGMSDDEAKTAGIEHDPVTGELIYKK